MGVVDLLLIVSRFTLLLPYNPSHFFSRQYELTLIVIYLTVSLRGCIVACLLDPTAFKQQFQCRGRVVYPPCWVLCMQVTLKTNTFMNFMRHVKCVF